MDLRQTMEQRCGHRSFTGTTYGVGNFEHSYNTFLPGNPMGDPIFDIRMEVSAECSTLVPTGYSVQQTRTSIAGIQSTEASSFSSFSHSEQSVLGFSAGFSFMGIGASYGQTETLSSSTSLEMKGTKRYFLTWIESVDATLSKGKALRSDFAHGFKKLIRKGTNARTGHQRHKIAFRLIGEFCNYMATGTLGSRLTELRIIDESKLTRMKSSNRSFNVQAEVNALFVTAGVSSSESSSGSTSQQELAKSSKTLRVISGAKPNMDTKTFPKAAQPGVLSATFRPICDVLPNDPDMSNLKSSCYDMYFGTTVCFAHLPPLSTLKSHQMYQVAEAMEGARRHDQCHHVPPGAINMRIDYRALGLLYVPDALTLRDCARESDFHRATSFSFVDRLCYMCFASSKTDIEKKLGRYKTSECSKAITNDAYGGACAWNQSASDPFHCTLQRPSDLADQHIENEGGCFALVPCAKNELCVTGFHRYPYQNILTGESETKRVIWAPHDAFVSGEYIVQKHFDVPGPQCSDEKIAAQKAWFNLAGQNYSLDDVRDIQRDVLTHFQHAREKCEEQCGQMEGCNAIFFWHPLLMRKVGINAHGHQSMTLENHKRLNEDCSKAPDWNGPWDSSNRFNMGGKYNTTFVRCQFLNQKGVNFLAREAQMSLPASNTLSGIPLKAFVSLPRN